MIEKRINVVLDKFQNVKKTAYGWQACCPAHDDHRPSLSIKIDKEKVLLHCHAGCTVDDVRDSAGLCWRDLFLENAPKSKQVATYNYRDERGELLFQTVRYKPKSFGVRHHDGDIRWIYNIDGVRRVPYRLPELLASRWCLVLEGEKDVRTAEKMKLIATCNAFGAGKWLAEYSEHFRGKHVFIIPDNDDPGASHARSVACSLFPIVKRLKIVRLPTGKDLTDWHELGGTRKQLISLIDDTPALKPEQIAAWQKSDSSTGEFHLIKVGDLLNQAEEQTRWIWEGILPSCGISLLVAKPKTGKSTLARQLAVRLAHGKKCLTRETKQGAVIYLALEEKLAELRRHFADLGANRDDPIYIHCSAAPQDALPKLTELVRNIRPALVIIDPILRMVRLKDLNDYAQVTLALEPLVALARENETHLLMVHHLRKGQSPDAAESILGSTALFGAVDTALIMQRTEHFRTIQSQQRYGDDFPESVLNFNEERRSMSLGPRRADADVERVCAEICEYLEKSNKARTRDQIDKAVIGRTGLKRAALRSLFKGQKVLRTGSGTKGDPFLFRCGAKEQESKVEPSE
jgi:putative DNA primase/helicase